MCIRDRFQAVPDSEMHSSAHDDGSVYWYYSTSAGKTAVSEFRTIDGKTYAFNEYGELVTGLKKVKVDSSDKKKIQNISSVDYISDIENVEDDVYVCYFGGDGAAKTGTQTLSCLLYTSRLGGPNEKPKYSDFAWSSMMFTAGLAADILFYSCLLYTSRCV